MASHLSPPRLALDSQSPASPAPQPSPITTLRRRVWTSLADNVAYRLSQPVGGSSSTPLQGRNPADWDEDEVCAWLRDSRLTQFQGLFREQAINGTVLMTMDGTDLHREPLASALKEEGLNKFGTIRTLELAIFDLRCRVYGHSKKDKFRHMSALEHPYAASRASQRLTFEAEDVSSALLRLVASFTYLLAVVFISSGVMTFAHDRVPDMEKYPPLPDVVLDHIPVIPYAFEASEVAILLQAFCFLCMIACHKYRLVLLRRFAAITASVFLLRCCTMLVTSLSVPGVHLSCKPLGHLVSFEDKVYHAWKIASTLGSSLQGTRTCGDYMFSGHTSVLTILNRFISTYTPKGWHSLHHFCSALNGFGMFCILAAHEHYTLDVLMGFYVSTRTFQSYHAVAAQIDSSVDPRSAGSTSGAARKQRRRWFPMVSFLEENATGIVPNEYEVPFASFFSYQ